MWFNTCLQRGKDRLFRNRAKILGFFAGATVSLYLGALASVIYTGTPIDLGPPVPTQVYSNF